MPTFLLLELSDPAALPLPFLDPGVMRVVMREEADTLADFANLLDLKGAGLPVGDDEDAVAAVARRLTESKPGPGAVAVPLRKVIDSPRFREQFPFIAAARAVTLPMGQPGDLEPTPDTAPPPHPRVGVCRPFRGPTVDEEFLGAVGPAGPAQHGFGVDPDADVPLTVDEPPEPGDDPNRTDVFPVIPFVTTDDDDAA